MTTKNKISLIAFAILLFVSYSCKNEEQNKINPVINTITTKAVNSNAKISYSGSTTIYQVDPVILGYFQHFCQSNSSDASIRSNGCGPVSYIMAAKCLAGYKGYTLSNYSGSIPWDTKAKHIKNNVLYGVPMYINYLPNYITSFDKYASSNSSINLINYVTAFAITYSADMRSCIETQLGSNHFVIVPLQAHVYDRTTVDNSNLYINGTSNPDYTVNENTGSYISNQASNSAGSNNALKIGGHYVVITGLYKNTSSSGSMIEYIDPLANTRANGASNRKYCNYDRFMASMFKNSSTGKANAIAVY